MATTTISGVFTPPAMGERYAPYPITQRGTVTVADDGIHLAGTRASGRGFIGLLGLVGVVAAFVVFFALDLSHPKLGAAFAIGGAALGGSVGFALSRAISRRPLAVTFPWAHVRSAHLAGGELLLLVKTGFLRKYQVHFTYDSAPEAQVVVDRLRGRAA